MAEKQSLHRSNDHIEEPGSDGRDEFVSYKSLTEPNDSDQAIEELREGAKRFEMFWLMPKRHNNETIKIRFRINNKLGGWRLKDGLISSMGLEVGETVNAEVSVLLGPGVIDDDGDMDLFADGDAADWLVRTVMEHGAEGTVVDCLVRTKYAEAPVGRNDSLVMKASLILEEGLVYVGKSEMPDDSDGRPRSIHDLIAALS